MITSAFRTASPTSATSRPASSARARLFEPGARPTITFTPDSWGFGGRVHDPGLAWLDWLPDLHPVSVGGTVLDQAELVLDRGIRRDVLDLEHVDQAVELLGCLFDCDIVGAERDGHPAHIGLVGV